VRKVVKNETETAALKIRYIHMLAVSKVVGANLFVGADNALSTGGPVSLRSSFSSIGMRRM
jgi:amino acid permease